MDQRKREQFLEILQLTLAGRQSSAAVQIQVYYFNLSELREAYEELGCDYGIDAVWKLALAAEEAVIDRYANPY